MNYAVKAEKRVGKNKTRPVYQKFSKFFDYERQIDRVKNEKRNLRIDFLGLEDF